MSHIVNRGFPLLSQNKHLTLLTLQHYEEWWIDFDQWFQRNFVESLKSIGKWVKYIFEIQFNLVRSASFCEYQDLFYRYTFPIYLPMDFLIDGQISSFCPDQHGSKPLTLIILHKLTQFLQNFKKIPF